MKLQKILTIGTIGAATIIGSYTALAQNDSELNNYSGYGSWWLVPSVQPIWSKSSITHTINEWEELIIPYGKLLENHEEINFNGKTLNGISTSIMQRWTDRSLPTIQNLQAMLEKSRHYDSDGDGIKDSFYGPDFHTIETFSYSGTTSDDTNDIEISKYFNNIHKDTDIELLRKGATTDSYIKINKNTPAGEYIFNVEICSYGIGYIYREGIPNFPGNNTWTQILGGWGWWILNWSSVWGLNNKYVNSDWNIWWWWDRILKWEEEERTHVRLSDANDDGIIDTKPTIEWSRIYGYEYKGIEMAIPEGFHMDTDGLPAIFPLNVSAPEYQEITAEKLVNPNGSNRDYINKIVDTKTDGDQKKFIFEDGQESEALPLDAKLFEYSTDNGNTWVEYLNREDVQLCDNCKITNIRISDNFRGIKTYNMVLETHYQTFVGTNPSFGWNPELYITGGSEKELTWPRCSPLEIKLNILAKEDTSNQNTPTPTDQPNDTKDNTTNTTNSDTNNTTGNNSNNNTDTNTDSNSNNNTDTNTDSNSNNNTDTSTPVTLNNSSSATSSPISTSGAGGYVENTPVTPFTPVNIESPSSNNINSSNPSIITPVVTETLEEKEKNSFSMNFTEVKETVSQILPSILPKMGVYTESSRSGNGMVRDNHGILRSAKEIFKLLETKVNSRDFRLAGSTNAELSYWLQVLDSHEQNMDKYVVIPSVGLVMPIADVNSTDIAYKNFLSGKTEHFYDYAGKGAVGIPDVGNKFGENGNKIIGGHSSWWKDDTSVKYKTHFQKIINLSIDTEIWVYEKDYSTGEYTRHIYKAEESYNTSETDVSILKQTKDSTLTLFTCTPIGGDIGRWVVKAKVVK